MTELDRIADKFLHLVVQAEAGATAEERAAALQAVIGEAGYFASVSPWEPGTDLFRSVSGADDIEVLLWLTGMLDTMPGSNECQHIVDRMISSRKRRASEEMLDTTDYETLAEAEKQVRGITAERPSLWAMIANLLRFG